MLWVIDVGVDDDDVVDVVVVVIVVVVVVVVVGVWVSVFCVRKIIPDDVVPLPPSPAPCCLMHRC